MDGPSVLNGFISTISRKLHEHLWGRHVGEEDVHVTDEGAQNQDE